jgi:hypothetical protein
MIDSAPLKDVCTPVYDTNFSCHACLNVKRISEFLQHGLSEQLPSAAQFERLIIHLYLSKIVLAANYLCSWIERTLEMTFLQRSLSLHGGAW